MFVLQLFPDEPNALFAQLSVTRLRKVLAVFAMRRRNSIDAEHLRGLPDYLLADVGIERAEIDAVCRDGGAPRRWSPGC